MTLDPKVIVALDLEKEVQLQQLLAQLNPTQCRLKIGKTLFTQYGPQWIKSLESKGFEVFLDLKFHDIPQQVAGACYQASQLGVWMTNVHALGGLKMLQAAKEAVDRSSQTTGKKTLLIGVTVLTSLGHDDLAQFGFTGKLEDLVLRLAGLCYEAKLDGVVCSAQEAKLLKKTFGKDFLCVTPGIRLPEDGKQDQQRVMTPQEAIQNGSDYLVIGRSITHAENPNQVLHQINTSLVTA